jgi:hypothetical protein
MRLDGFPLRDHIGNFPKPTPAAIAVIVMCRLRHMA